MVSAVADLSQLGTIAPRISRSSMGSFPVGLVSGIGGCIRSRSRAGCGDVAVGECARTLLAYKDKKPAESRTEGTRRLRIVPDEGRNVLETYSPPPSTTDRRCRH